MFWIVTPLSFDPNWHCVVEGILSCLPVFLVAHQDPLHLCVWEREEWIWGCCVYEHCNAVGSFVFIFKCLSLCPCYKHVPLFVPNYMYQLIMRLRNKILVTMTTQLSVSNIKGRGVHQCLVNSINFKITNDGEYHDITLWGKHWLYHKHVYFNTNVTVMWYHWKTTGTCHIIQCKHPLGETLTLL